MSLLLLFGGAGGGGATEYFGAVSFDGVGTFTVTYSVFGAVSFDGVGTFTPSAGVPVFALWSFEASSGFLAVPRFVGDDYRLYVVDMFGAVQAECENAKLGEFSTELDGAGAGSFTLPTTDPDALVAVPGREVQLWRGNQLLWWGPIVRPQAGLDETSWQCAGLLWYFAHRFMGRADRVNGLVNGDFEASETGWSFSGVTHSASVVKKIEGTKSLLLSGATADHNTYATQTFTHTSATPVGWPGDFLTMSAYVYVPSASYLGGAREDRGLFAIRRLADGTVVDVQSAVIADDTVKDAWVHLEVGIPWVKYLETIEVRLYPPHGSAYYDLVTLTFMESLSFTDPDIADIVAGIVDYAQDRGPFTHGKSDLNIDHSCPATGQTISGLFAYQFAEHRNIEDAIQEYVRQGIIDIDIALTPTTRTFTSYHPRKGAYRSDLLLELDTNVADFTWSWDGEAAASNVVELGPGDGPDRPEGGATADSTFLDGLTLEWVESAPDYILIGQLDDRAAERLGVAIHPEIVEVTTLPGAGIIGQLQSGDTVPVNIQRGIVAIDHVVYRAVKISIDPHTDQAHVTLNRAS